MTRSHHYTLSDIGDIMTLAERIDARELQRLLEDEGHLDEQPRKRAAQALALFRATEIPTDEVHAHARRRVDRVNPEKNTFVPIFATNHCHAECAMCGMRRGNEALVRKFATRSVIEEQLEILRNVEGICAAGFLTGEYADTFTRFANAFYIGWAINKAMELGFKRIFFNIGSMQRDEIAVLSDWLNPGDPRVTMCVFQETYDLHRFSRVMGRAIDTNPKADFARRLDSFDNWLDAGFTSVNPGFLVGLHDLECELVEILLHTDHLIKRGARVDISLPRLRPALGASNRVKVDDETYARLLAVVAFVSPHTGIVLTTREDVDFQDRVLPLIHTLSPGSPDVAPYRRDQAAANDVHSSQFLIPDRRRPREILLRLTRKGYRFKNFEIHPAIDAQP